MPTEDRTGHSSEELDIAGLQSQGTQNAPHKRAVTLLKVPRMEMVGEKEKIEASLLRETSIVDESRGGMLLSG